MSSTRTNSLYSSVLDAGRALRRGELLHVGSYWHIVGAFWKGTRRGAPKVQRQRQGGAS